MITGNEKAWAGTGVGIITTAITFILAQLPDTDQLATVRLALVILGGLVGIVGSGIGVYAMTNTPATPAPALVKAEPTVSAVPVTELERQAAAAQISAPVPQTPDPR